MIQGHWILKNKRIVKVPLMTWAKWFRNSPDRFIAKTKVKKVLVSTVFLGIDHNFSEKGKPVLFETMIFGTKNKALRDYQVRYRTLKEAEKGHKDAVAFTEYILN